MQSDYAIYYLPEKNETLMLYYGTGDNLTREDLDNGFNDYMNTYWYKGKVTPKEFLDKDDDWDEGCYDGGMFLFNNQTLKTEDIVSEVLFDWYYAKDICYEYLGSAMEV